MVAEEPKEEMAALTWVAWGIWTTDRAHTGEPARAPPLRSFICLSEILGMRALRTLRHCDQAENS